MSKPSFEDILQFVDYGCNLWIVVIIVYGICGLVAICGVVCGFIMFCAGKVLFLL